MIMRVVSFMQENMPAFSEVPEIQDAVNSLRETIAELLETLDESERDALLEHYGAEAALLGLSKPAPGADPPPPGK